MENKACILKNTVVTLNMYLNLVFTKNVRKLEDIDSRNVSVITSSVKKNILFRHMDRSIYTYLFHWNILIHELLVLA